MVKRADSESVHFEILTDAERTARALELRKAARQDVVHDVKKGKEEVARLEQETRDRLRTGTCIESGLAKGRGRGRGEGRGRPVF